PFPTNPDRVLSWSLDGRLLAFLDADNTIRLRTVSDTALFRTFSGFPAEVLDFTFGFDSHTLITISQDKTLRTWDITAGDLLQTQVVQVNDKDFGNPSFFFRNARSLGVFTGSYSSNTFMQFYDVATGKLTQSLTGYEPGQRFECMAFSSDGRTLAIERQDHRGVDLWD